MFVTLKPHFGGSVTLEPQLTWTPANGDISNSLLRKEGLDGERFFHKAQSHGLFYLDEKFHTEYSIQRAANVKNID